MEEGHERSTVTRTANRANDQSLPGITELRTGVVWRNPIGTWGHNRNNQRNVAGSVSYVTGSHSMKAGYSAAYEVTDIFGNYASHGLQDRFGSSAAGAAPSPRSTATSSTSVARTRRSA